LFNNYARGSLQQQHTYFRWLHLIKFAVANIIIFYLFYSKELIKLYKSSEAFHKKKWHDILLISISTWLYNLLTLLLTYLLTYLTSTVLILLLIVYKHFFFFLLSAMRLNLVNWHGMLQKNKTNKQTKKESSNESNRMLF